MKKMAVQNIFHAYDIRGKYPEEINENVAGEIVKLFLAEQFRKLKTKTPKNPLLTIVIGCDARLSSPALYKAVINNLKNKNYRLKLVGLSTTPMLSFLVSYWKADYGIMITASHNPKEYNGLKIVGENAAPVSGYEIRSYFF